MKKTYQKPEMEVVTHVMTNLVCDSITGIGGGSGMGYGGGGSGSGGSIVHAPMMPDFDDSDDQTDLSNIELW